MGFMKETVKLSHVLTGKVITQDLLSLPDVTQSIISHAQNLAQMTFIYRAVDFWCLVEESFWSTIQIDIHFCELNALFVSVAVCAIAAVIAKVCYCWIDSDVIFALEWNAKVAIVLRTWTWLIMYGIIHHHSLTSNVATYPYPIERVIRLGIGKYMMT